MIENVSNIILIICDVDSPNIIPLYESPLKNSKINLPIGYIIKYIFNKYLLYFSFFER